MFVVLKTLTDYKGLYRKGKSAFMTHSQEEIIGLLARIASALEVQAGTAAPEKPDWTARAFIWQAGENRLKAAQTVDAVPLELLVGLEDHAATLLQNTRQFAAGYPANNALLWGARGMGKSSLVKAVFAAIGTKKLKLVEIHREDIESLPQLLHLLAAQKRYRFLLFCDDLSFDEADTSYKSLKAVLEGGIEGRPDNVLFYATSNRRHMMQRDMIENESGTAIHPGEAVEEKVSLSDRFGLWLGFYPCDQEQYLEMIDNYISAFRLKGRRAELHDQALEWAKTRGARSGRVAWQFVQDTAGKQKRTLAA